MINPLQGPTDQTKKIVFARSGNRCAFLGCEVELVQGNTLIADICHIRGDRPTAPRHDPDQPPSERHAPANLIILCPNHHRMIDADVHAYTVDRLLAMKADHEQRTPPLSDAEAELTMARWVDQTVTSYQQSGGITAHTVNIHGLQPTSDRRATIFKLAEELHLDRIEKIKARLTELKSQQGSLIVIHVIPFQSIGSERDPAFSKVTQNVDYFLPIGVRHSPPRKIGFDGLLVGSNIDGLDKPQRAYVQVSQTCVLESVATAPACGENHDFLVLPELHANIIKYAYDHAHALNRSGVGLPFAVFVSLVSVRGKRLLQDFIHGLPEDVPCGTLDRSDYHFGHFDFYAVPTGYGNAARELRPMLDLVASLAGLGQAPYFDIHGNYELTGDLASTAPRR